LGIAAFYDNWCDWYKNSINVLKKLTKVNLEPK
jgi:hypothetical protein